MSDHGQLQKRDENFQIDKVESAEINEELKIELPSKPERRVSGFADPHLDLPFGMNRPGASHTTMAPAGGHRFTMNIENETNKDRANTDDGTPGNKSQMVEKRSIIGKTAELIKEGLFSDGTSEGQVRLEDF